MATALSEIMKQAEKLSAAEQLELAAKLIEINRSAEDGTTNGQEQQPRHEGMLAVLARSKERLKNMPFSGSTEDSLKILHQGRAGEMYGYEPTE
jgi:hypothetical protein